MTVSYTCDWCGEAIEGGSKGPEYGEAHLSSTGLHEDYGLAYKDVGHFHAGRFRDEDSCLLQAIRLIKERFGTMPRVVSEDAERIRLFELQRERRQEWQRSPWAYREGALFDVLADERLTISELTERLELHGLYASDVRTLLRRMVERRQLEREPEPFRGKVRYRYFQRRGLEGPIADLERAFHNDGETAA